MLEFIPETVYKVARQYSKSKQTIPPTFIKLYMYQLFRSLAYIHSQGICHRDIKPQNLLLDPGKGEQMILVISLVMDLWAAYGVSFPFLFMTGLTSQF